MSNSKDIEIFEYKLVVADSASIFEQKVNDCIKEGWSFLGNVTAVLSSGSPHADRQYVREMIRCSQPNLVNDVSHKRYIDLSS